MTKQECYELASKCWRDKHDGKDCKKELLDIFATAIQRMDVSDILNSKKSNSFFEYISEVRNGVIVSKKDEYDVINSYISPLELMTKYGKFEEDGLECFYQDYFDSDLGYMADIYQNKVYNDKNKVTIVVKEPNKDAKIKVIDDSLESMQEIVGGLIEYVPMPEDESVDIWVNEEGKMMGLKPNVFTFNAYGGYMHADALVGTIFFAGHDDEGGMCSLTEDQLRNVLCFCKNNQIYNENEEKNEEEQG